MGGTGGRGGGGTAHVQRPARHCVLGGDLLSGSNSVTPSHVAAPALSSTPRKELNTTPTALLQATLYLIQAWFTVKMVPRHFIRQPLQ